MKVQNGPAFARALEGMGIYPEMEDGGHVVFICTAQDREEDLDRLEHALEALERDMGPCPPLPAPPAPERVLSPRQALFAPMETLPLGDCLGRWPPDSWPPIPPASPWWPQGSGSGKKNFLISPG